MKSHYMIQSVRAIADLTELSPNRYELNRISVPAHHQGKGYGTVLLKQICAEADQEGAVITLWINAYGRLSKTQLREWYNRYGWQHYIDQTLIRYPQENQ